MYSHYLCIILNKIKCETACSLMVYNCVIYATAYISYLIHCNVLFTVCLCVCVFSVGMGLSVCVFVCSNRWPLIGLYDLVATGVCFSCRMIERMRDTSRLDLFDFGLKSHSFAMRSHSVPGAISSVSETNCFSAFLRNGGT